MAGSNNRRCSRCGKVFSSRAGADAHIRDKHAGDGKRIPVGRQPSQDSEQSMASLLIEAELDRAMGLSVDEDLADMLP